MNKLINKIKKQIKDEYTFLHWNDVIGLTFEDFTIVDTNSNIIYQQGKKDIGNYTISIKDNEIEAINYDMDNDAVKNYGLEMLQKIKNIEEDKDLLEI